MVLNSSSLEYWKLLSSSTRVLTYWMISWFLLATVSLSSVMMSSPRPRSLNSASRVWVRLVIVFCCWVFSVCSVLIWCCSCVLSYWSCCMVCCSWVLLLSVYR